MFSNPLFLSVALSHFVVDVLNGQISVVLTYLSGPLSLSNASLALISTAYTVSGALTQPIFGYISDRFGARWVVAGGVTWMAVFFSIGLILPGETALVFLVLTAVGSGAFHPAGTMEATALGRTHFSGKETTASSYFFIFGQTGLFVGPLLAGLMLERFGKLGLLVVTLMTIPIGLGMLYTMRTRDSLPEKVPDRGKIAFFTIRSGKGFILVLALVSAGSAWIGQSMGIFIPKYLNDLGSSASLYGGGAALFLGGAALGLVAGGHLADRVGKRRVATLALFLASFPLLLIPNVVQTWWMFLILPLAGAFSGASHSILVVFAQRLFPAGMGLASGLILGFMFTSGSLGVLVSGFVADLAGVETVFPLAAGLAILSSLCATRLPSE